MGSKLRTQFLSHTVVSRRWNWTNAFHTTIRSSKYWDPSLVSKVGHVMLALKDGPEPLHITLWLECSQWCHPSNISPTKKSPTEKIVGLLSMGAKSVGL